MKKFLKIFALIIVVSMMFVMLSACGSDDLTNFENSVVINESTSENLENGSSNDSLNGNSIGGTTDESNSSNSSNLIGSNTHINANNKTYIKINANNLNVRSLDGTIIGQVLKNELLPYVSESGNYFITYFKGGKAKVKSSYCSLISIEMGSLAVENVMAVAEKQLGFTYDYGAQRLHWGNGKMNSNFKYGHFDCSSLVQYAFYYGNGTLLDVTSRGQYLQGTYVTTLKRGDLMFFTNASRKHLTGIDRVGHVGVYLGDGYILHTASTYSKIEPISSARWSNFIVAKRII